MFLFKFENVFYYYYSMIIIYIYFFFLIIKIKKKTIKMSYQNKIMRIKQIMNTCSNKDRELILNEIMSYVSEKNNININKLTGGSISESTVCNILGYEWNKNSIHGADGFDKNGEMIEIKTFIMPTKTRRININYKFPTKKIGESQKEHYNKIRLFVEKYKGGHVWVFLNRNKTDILNHWKLDSKNFSIAMVNRCKNYYKENKKNMISINLGCNICNRCNKPHRSEEIVKLINEGSDIPSYVVKQDCKNKIK